MKWEEVKGAFAAKDMTMLDVMMSVLLPALPVVGIAGFITGLIDMDFGFTREMGIRKVVSFLISHAVYMLAIIGGAVL